jgi:hypothetical protein
MVDNILICDKPTKTPCLYTHLPENKHIMRKASIEVEGKHFDLDMLMSGDMKFV